MHPRIAIRRARNTKPIEVAAAFLKVRESQWKIAALFASAPYDGGSFCWPATYEEGIQRRTYQHLPQTCERADCGCLVRTDRLFVDPRNAERTICETHGNIVACMECSRPSGYAITPETEAQSRKGQAFYCSDLCAANVAA